MTTIEEAWDTWPHGLYYEVYGQHGTSIEFDIDKWCREVVLAAHVAACEKMEIGDEGYTGKHCGGDDWYCDEAKKILQLGC